MNVMPKYWMELDDESIARAITALAAELGLDPVPEEQAHFLVAVVYAQLDAARHRRNLAKGITGPVIPPALRNYGKDAYEPANE